MSTNFHANQYEQAFTPHRLQNWEVPKNEQGKYPKAQTGFTRIKATDRGHLLPGVPRERSSPWGSFVGTWDMPNKIPGNRTLNPTARCEDAVLNAQSAKVAANDVLSGGLKRCHTVEPLPVKYDAPEASGAAAAHPIAAAPACASPVANPASPKPVTPMAVADVNVQEAARQAVSPLADGNNNAAIGGLKTPDGDLQQRAGSQPDPADRIVGMKSPPKTPVEALAS